MVLVTRMSAVELADSTADSTAHPANQTITQGVPQGSVLGPIFYILYANDLAELFENCEVALYANDTVLYKASPNFETSVDKMQQDLSRLGDWCGKNGIYVNTSKTKLLVFGSKMAVDNLAPYNVNYDGSPLLHVASYKYLGVTMDRQLNYNLHVKKNCCLCIRETKAIPKNETFLKCKGGHNCL